MYEVEELRNDRANAAEVPGTPRPAKPLREILLVDVDGVPRKVHVLRRREEDRRRARCAAFREVRLLVPRILLIVLARTELHGVHEDADYDLIRPLPLRLRDERKMPLVQVAHRRDERDLLSGEIPRLAPLLQLLRFCKDPHNGEYYTTS